MSTPPIKRACDACHRRKVRCSGGQPCRNCGQASLHCTYLAVPQKKGPKGSRAKVISELRDTQHHQRQQLSPSSSSSLIQAEKPAKGPPVGPLDFNLSPLTSPTTTTTTTTNITIRHDPGLLTQQTIDSCINFFFTHMYPTVPILHRDRLVDLISTQRLINAEVYCLAAAMCAFILIQPGMTHPGSAGINGEPSPAKYALAAALVEDLQRVRGGFDYVENPTLLTVYTSFFLFGSYFGLEKQNHAWFHLREASTMAVILDMHEESSYMRGDPVESIFQRRLYWVLLVTERAYAMERRRPLTLYATIELPTTDEAPEEAAIISGFLCLIRLFRIIDDDFIGLWNKARSECSTTWLSQLQKKLTDALPAKLQSTESQAADIKVTQQWLRIMVWQLSIMNGNLSSSSTDSSMTFQYPIEVARDLIRDVSSFSQSALEIHGVGLIEKIFDVACTLTDVIALVPLDPTHSAVSGQLPSDYLNQILDLIARLRGGASRFLPILLAKVSENLPTLAGPIHNIPFNVESDYSDSALSPSASSHSTRLIHKSPVSPYGPPPPLSSGVSDQGLMFAGYSPATTGSEPGMTPTDTPTIQMAAPIPRSVPRFQYDAYNG